MTIGVNSRIFQKDATGIPNYVKSLYSYLIKKDSQNNYVFFQTSRVKTIGKTLITKLPQNSLGNILFDGFFVNNLIKKARPNIFHGPAHILPIHKIKGVKYVLTIHDLSFIVFPEFENGLFNIYFKNMVGRSLQNADLVVTDSKNTKKDVIKYYKTPKDKIKVVYPGVDEIFFEKKSIPRLIKQGYFLSITTHPKRKNIIAILKLFATSRDLIKKNQFVIAGYMTDRDALQLDLTIKQLGLKSKAVILRYVTKENLISLYKYADCLLYPSLYEGFGLPVLEAYALGCPVITSNRGSLVELCTDKRWLIDPEKPDELKGAIKNLAKLSSDEKSRLVYNNYQFSANFRWRQAAKQMSELFNSL